MLRSHLLSSGLLQPAQPVFKDSSCLPVAAVLSVMLMWKRLSGGEALDLSTAVEQSAWDRPVVDSIKGKVWASVSDDLNLTRLAAISAPCSGDWLCTMSSSSCGIRLDDEAVG